MKLLLSIVMAGLLSAGSLFAQATTDKVDGCCPMMGAHKNEMAEWHQKMIEKFKAQNADFEKLVAEMNAAPAEKKTDAIVAVINKMAADRKEWASDAEAFHKKMGEWVKERKEKLKEKLKKELKED